MLVLSRKPGERILIGDEVSVTIVRIGPNTVRLGIDAPRSMNIVPFTESPRREKAIVAGSIPTNVARPNKPGRIAVSPAPKLIMSKEITGKRRKTSTAQAP